uniref:Glucuronosyltransferase n=1 Tax=Rhabditophanes sp. KR3021 TaxID=114890 RepID=A0AC35TXV5_9BILA
MKSFFLLALLVVNVVESVKVLVYLPEFGRSHMKHMGKLADILAQSGNDVTVLVSPFDPVEKDQHGIKLAKIIRGKINPNLQEQSGPQKEQFSKMIWDTNMESPIGILFMTTFVAKAWTTHCQGLIDNDELTAQIKAENFDIAIGEGFDSCIFGLYTQYGIKNHIIVSSGLFFSPHYELLGLQYPSTQVPELFADFGSKGVSMWERAKNQYFGIAAYLFLKRPMIMEQALFDQKFGNGVVDMRKTFRECAYYMTNGDPLIDFAKPITSKVIEIGGFSIPKAKLLDAHYDKVMNLRTRNVLISFGSNAKSSMMPDNYKQNLRKVIKSFPDVTFIWKYEVDNDGIAEGLDNLIIGKWLPQTDILADKRLSGFITHGGLNSLTEASQVGVPLILIGLFGDQKRNTQVAERIQFGKGITKFQLADYDIVRNSIDEVFFQSDKYKKAAIKLMDSIKNKPFNSTEVFVKYVEYAAKYGAQPMFNMLGEDQCFFARNNIDLFAILITLLFLLSFFKLRNYLLYNLESLCLKENVSKVVVSFKKLTRFTRHFQELISTWPQIDSMEFRYDNRDTEQLGLPKFFKTVANRSNMVVIRTRASFKDLITTSDGNVITLKNKFSLHLRFDGNGEGCTIEDWTKFFAKNELKNVFFKSDETVPIGELIAFIRFLIEVMKMDKIVKFHIQLNQMDYSWNQRDMLCVLTAENVDTLDHTNVYQDFEVRYTVTKNNGEIGIIGVELF